MARPTSKEIDAMADAIAEMPSSHISLTAIRDLRMLAVETRMLEEMNEGIEAGDGM